jgi:hypothetical protein
MRLAPLLLAACAMVCVSATDVAALNAGSDSDLAVSNIRPELLADVDAVVRVNEVVFEATAANRARTTVRRVVTVLNQNGRFAGDHAVYYDSFRRIRSYRATLLDAEGNRVRRISRDEFTDVSSISGFSLYQDARVRGVDVRHDRYPYTIVFEYEIDHRGILNWPSWHPIDVPASLEWGRLLIKAPPDISVRYHVRGDMHGPTIRRDRHDEYEWVVENLAYEKPEPFGPPVWLQYPSVMVAPDRFEIGGHPGRMDSWEAFARWYHELSDGRDRLTREAQEDVGRIVDGASSTREAVQRLYQHAQDVTRYVNVTLGIGGWQPYDARYVLERGYGDCKALTNFVYALLKEAGIKSYPALIRSEHYPGRTVPDFSNNQFNHAILMVPLPEEADTLWLETTSQTIPFGHIGASNENRWALVVKESGGALVRTPASTASINAQMREARIVLDAEGNAHVNVETRYSGNQQDRMRPLATAGATTRERWLHSAMGLRDYRIIRADFNSLAIRSDSLTLPVELTAPRYAARMGSRLMFEPNMLERRTSIPEELAQRRHEVFVASYPFLDVDRLEFTVPDGFRVEAQPQAVQLVTPFGSYAASVSEAEDGRLIYERRFKMTETILPADSYGAYREFLQAVVRADAARVVLVAD